jgi:hypothetical protein
LWIVRQAAAYTLNKMVLSGQAHIDPDLINEHSCISSKFLFICDYFVDASFLFIECRLLGGMQNRRNDQIDNARGRRAHPLGTTAQPLDGRTKIIECILRY